MIPEVLASISRNIILSKATRYACVGHTQDEELRVGLTAVHSDVGKSLDIYLHFIY